MFGLLPEGSPENSPPGWYWNLVTSPSDSGYTQADEDFPQLVINNGKTVYDFMWVGIAHPAIAAKAAAEGKNILFLTTMVTPRSICQRYH